MSLDQFYTNENIANQCFSILKKNINIDDFDIQLEPSAGNGSFYKLLDTSKRIGIDLDPKHDEIKKEDFLEYKADLTKKYIIIGNPPFGKISSLAVKFFNKSAMFADVIAFIVPRTFNRMSIQNKLSLYMHLVYSEDLPENPCCFTPKMSAKCCFQIWKKSNTKRKIKEIPECSDFSFIKLGPLDENKQPTIPENYDFVMRAYGSNCGEIRDANLNNLRPKSWHWIKANIDIEVLKKRFKSLDYSISKNTVRQNSLGKKELILLYTQKY